MSSRKPPAFTPLSRTADTDRNASGEGRLASSGPSGLTRGGNARTKFTPRHVERKPAEGVPPSLTATDAPKERAAPAGRGRGRGKGRGEVPLASGISGPFAAGPAGITRSASTRQLGRTVDTSITIEDAPLIGSTSQTLPSSTPQVVVKTEKTTPKQASLQSQQPKVPRIKREEDVYGDGYDLGEVADNLDRVDLSQLNLPGGPISSSRAPEKRARGWKKIEMWIEQEDPEEIVIDEVGEVAEPTTSRAPVRVKFEDEQMEDVVVPDEIAPTTTMDVDSTHNEQFLQMAEKRRRKLWRKQMKGKSREEKEEIASEEVDFELLQKTFLEDDASQRENRLLMVQLPLTLPPLRPVDQLHIKQEVKIEDSTAPEKPITHYPPPQGKIGQLLVHASGKTILSYGGIEFPLRLANEIRFPQDCMVINPGIDRKIWRVGRVGSRTEDCTWLIGVPDLRSLASQ